MNLREYLKTCIETYHTTLDPESPGVVRIHLIPPKKLKPNIPWVVIINGYHILPLQSAWGVLLKVFIETLNTTKKAPLSEADVKEVIDATVNSVKAIFPLTDKDIFKTDLKDMVQTFADIARGKEVNEDIGYMSLAEYGKYMSSPHRMDLMISAMEKNGCWNCNCECIHCYAKGETLSSVEELATDDWKKVIDKLKEIGIPQITFTGGEPTIRGDLVELVDYSKWFMTRLNTNGILLSKELCNNLRKASLDSVQITLYSSNEAIHNMLVGGNHFKDTVEGIKNAIEAGLDVSINTPLCSLNKDYLETVKFASNLGIRYFSSSGLIPSGNALKDDSVMTRLTTDEIKNVLKEALEYGKDKELEFSFTSPGWIDEKFLKRYKMVVPSCGACLSNMAITPDGLVIPCQSWLGGENFGSILDLKWKDIWNNKACKNIRKEAMKTSEKCLLWDGKKDEEII